MKKRWIVIFMLLMFVFSSSAVMAADIFSDVKSDHWAAKDIARMRAKGVLGGVSDTEFAPNNPVTKEMLVVMLVRVTGKENQAGGEIPASFVQRDKVSPYAKGAMAYAVREGIITGSLLHSDPTEPVKRHEVAEIVVRAMGLTNEAQEKKYDTLNYSDALTIPLDSRGFVKVMQEKGIMGGDVEGRFNPNDSLTRAQIASVLNRIDNEVNALSNNTIKGKIYSFSSASITIENSSGIVQPAIPLANNVMLFKGKAASIADFAKNDMVEIIKDAKGNAVYIEAGNFKFDDIVIKGEITDITGNNIKIVTIKKEDGSSETYTLSSTAKVTVNGQNSSVSQLAVGQPVTARIGDKLITSIDIIDETRIFNGVIENINYSADTIRIERANNEGIITLTVDRDTEFRIGRKDVDLDDLIEGMEVQVIAKASKAIQITASDLEQTIEGVLVEVSLSDMTITILNEKTKKEETYEVDKDANIRRDKNKNLTLRDIYPNDEIEIELINKVVTRIYANSVEGTAEGIVQEIIIGTTPAIVIRTNDGDEERFSVANNARIRRDRESINFNEIAPGDWVRLDLEGKQATRIDVEARSANSYVIGYVDYISSAVNGFYVLDYDNQEEKLVLWDADTQVLTNDRLRDMNEKRITDGDEVIVVGFYDGRDFVARLIVVVNTIE